MDCQFFYENTLTALSIQGRPQEFHRSKEEEELKHFIEIIRIKRDTMQKMAI